MAIGLVNAQDFKSKRGENMLPEQGDWAIGFNADGIFEYVGNAFNGNVANNAPTVNYSKGFEGSFVGKYFTSDKSAYRVIFNLETVGTTQKLSTSTADNTIVNTPALPAPNVVVVDVLQTERKQSFTEISLGFGKEWRRGKTRLQGFYGADVLLIYQSSSDTNNRYEEELTTVVAPAQTIKNIVQTDIDTKFGSAFGIGAQGFIGAEYFLFPKIAIGAQYTYGARYISQSEGVKTTVVTNSTNNSLPVAPAPAFQSVVTTDVDKTPSGSASGLTGVGVVSINLTLHF